VTTIIFVAIIIFYFAVKYFMNRIKLQHKKGRGLSSRSVLMWRVGQITVWLIGAAILFCLLFFPVIGLLLFWNILIPVAPALLVVGPGLWRNVCPLATTNLLPRHFGLSKKIKLSAKQLGMFNLIGIIALYIIVPLRHAIFNTSGLATALLIIGLAICGIILGFFYEWKSAWCSGLCPIHPVEKLYGGNSFTSLPNLHCTHCANCVVPCPDSSPNIRPGSSKKTIWHKMSGILTAGGLPGFIWGWFHVPDKEFTGTFAGFFNVYKMPFIGFAFTLIIYGVLSITLNSTQSRLDKKLTGFFAAMGVSCYYWYRIPALLGFGTLGEDGLLIDLRYHLSQWTITALTFLTTIFFFYWLFFRKQSNKSWLIRPEFVKKEPVKHKLSA
jgi:hypothetical protein